MIYSMLRKILYVINALKYEKMLNKGKEMDFHSLSLINSLKNPAIGDKSSTSYANMLAQGDSFNIFEATEIRVRIIQQDASKYWALFYFL